MAGIHAANSYRIASTLGLAKELEADWRSARSLTEAVEAVARGKQFPGRLTTWRARSGLRAASRRKRMPNYPYLAENHIESGVDILKLAASLVPANIPDQYRADMCQDLVLAFLSARIDPLRVTPDDVKKEMRKTWRLHDLQFETVSLDAPITAESVRTFRDFLTYDALDRWDVPTKPPTSNRGE